MNSLISFAWSSSFGTGVTRRETPPVRRMPYPWQRYSPPLDPKTSSPEPPAIRSAALLRHVAYKALDVIVRDSSKAWRPAANTFPMSSQCHAAKTRLLKNSLPEGPNFSTRQHQHGEVRRSQSLRDAKAMQKWGWVHRNQCGVDGFHFCG